MEAAQIAWWTIVPLSAVVSATVTLAIRYLDKPRPRLTLVGRGVLLTSDQMKMRDAYGSSVTLHNHGAGPAYGVRVIGSDCVVGVRLPKAHDFGAESWTDTLGAVGPGQTVVLDVNNIEDRVRARIVITREAFPSLPALHWLKRSRTYRLSRVPFENPYPPAMHQPERIPAFRRFLGWVSRYGLTERIPLASWDADSRD